MSKTLREENLLLNMIVKGDKARAEVNKLDRAYRDLSKEVEYLESAQKKLRAEGKKDSEAERKLTAEIMAKKNAMNQAAAELDHMRKNMDINRMSMRDLRAEMTRLRRLATDPLNKEWQKHSARLQQVKARYGELQARANATKITLQGLTSTLNRMYGSIAAGIATFAALAFGVRRATDEFTKFDDKIADVQKTTGLAKSQVLDMNEELKDINFIDTRTSQEGLLGLLRIAGKLGTEGTDNLLGFVKATDQIAVALTEDLGGDIEESINTVGKLVGIFNISDEFGIEEGLLKVGSAINELGANSEANEGYIVDFTKRLAGVAPGAKISIADIMGMGAALDVAGQSVEVSGTAISQIITKMFDDTASFARVAGMEVSDFSNLLETDANAAFITLLEGIKGNDERMAMMVGRLKELGIDGVRATNVMGVLANNVDELKKQQTLANKAFSEGSSITDEFNIKNNTAGAQLEKVQKQINNLWIELGERLFPTVMEGTKLFKSFLEVLILLFDFLKSHYRIIIILAAAIAGYQSVVIASTIATKAATIATRLWNSALRANPIGIVISLLATLGTALYFYTRKTNAAIDAQVLLNEAQKKSADGMKEERDQIDSLLKVARNKELSDGARREAIKQLVAISPEYLSTLSLETINTQEATDAVRDYIDAKQDQILIDEILTKKREINKKQEEARGTISTSKQELEQDNGGLYGWGSRKGKSIRLNEQISDAENELSQLAKAEGSLQVALDDIIERQAQRTADKQAELAKKAAEDAAKNRKKYLTEEQQDRVKAIQEYRDKVLLESKSLVEQERIAYKERIKEAGLYGKTITKMTSDEFAVWEALRIAHQANLAKIDADAISAEIARYETSFQSELNALKVKQNEELKAFEGTKEQREQLIRQQTSEEEALVKANLENLQSLIQLTLDKGSWDGITSDDILSDEEYQLLKEKLEAIGLSLSELGLSKKSPKDADTPEELGFGDTDILGFSQEDWELFFENIQNGEKGIQSLIFATRAFSEAWQMHNDYVSQAEKRKLENFEKDTDARKQAINDQMDRELERAEGNADRQKAIRKKYNNQLAKLDADLDKKKAQFDYNEAKREKQTALMNAIVNTAAAVAEALPNIALSIIAGSIGGFQIGKIASTPLPEIPGREVGGYLDVTRSQDRRMFRAKRDPGKRGYVHSPTVITGENGTEFVASNQAFSNPTVRPMLDILDTAQRNGTISTVNLTKVLNDRPAVSMSGYERGGYISNTSNAGDVSSPNSNDPEIKNLIRKNTSATMALYNQLRKGIKADVSLLGKGGFVEAQEDLDEINNNVNF